MSPPNPPQSIGLAVKALQGIVSLSIIDKRRLLNSTLLIPHFFPLQSQERFISSTKQQASACGYKTCAMTEMVPSPFMVTVTCSRGLEILITEFRTYLHLVRQYRQCTSVTTEAAVFSYLGRLRGVHRLCDNVSQNYGIWCHTN